MADGNNLTPSLCMFGEAIFTLCQILFIIVGISIRPVLVTNKNQYNISN